MMILQLLLIITINSSSARMYTNANDTGIAGNMHAFQRNIDETLESVINGCNITAHRIVNYSTADDQLQHIG